jgi:hypothetical protein
MQLLFVPLDIVVPNGMLFKLGDNRHRRQQFWSTHSILGKETNYVEHRWLFDQLPFTEVEIFTHKIQLKEVRPHVDHDVKNSSLEKLELLNSIEPAGYHIVLQGNNNSLEIYNGVNWVTPILPNAPSAYALNLTSCIHRVRTDPGRTTLYIEGKLDVEKHRLLIERSVKKYKELAVYNSTKQQ